MEQEKSMLRISLVFFDSHMRMTNKYAHDILKQKGRVRTWKKEELFF